MGARVGVRDPARHLARMHRAIAHETEHWRRIIARLHAKFRIVNRFAIDPRWRAGFEATLRQLHFLESRAERRGGGIPRTPGGVVLQTDVNQTGEECACG